jgi:hypothetical protein
MPAVQGARALACRHARCQSTAVTRPNLWWLAGLDTRPDLRGPHASDRPAVADWPPRGSGALRAIDASARPRSWRTFGPRRLRRQSQPGFMPLGVVSMSAALLPARLGEADQWSMQYGSPPKRRCPWPWSRRSCQRSVRRRIASVQPRSATNWLHALNALHFLSHVHEEDFRALRSVRIPSITG